MLATHHILLSNEEVRGRRIGRCAAAKTSDGHVIALAAGIGLPRLWTRVASAATAAFVEGFARSDARGRARVDDAVKHARTRASAVGETLIERMLPDVTFVASVLEGDQLHVVSAGTARAYLHRGLEPKRLTARDESNEGLLRAPLAHSSASLIAGDVVLLGSQSAFSVRAIGKLSSALGPGSRVEPEGMTALLVGPAEEAGVGAVAAALRVH